MRSRRGIGILAVCGLVFGLMAINATGAQAAGCTAAEPTKTPCWMVNGKNVTATLKIIIILEIEPLGVGKEKHLVLLTTSGGNAVSILCGEATVTEAVLEAEGKGHGKVNFNKCTTAINGTAEPACNPLNQPIASGGTLNIVKHEGKTYAKAEGEGGTFATLKFECASLPETVAVTGTAWIEDCENKFETEQLTHLIQEAMVPALALGGLKFGKNAATIDGSINVTVIHIIEGIEKKVTFSGLG